MAFFARHARILYALALFQLVGGPLVLGGLMMLVRLGSDKNMALTEAVAQTIDRAQRMAQNLSAEELGMPVDAVPAPAEAPTPVPDKTKEGKLELIGMFQWFESPLQISCESTRLFQCWHDPTAVIRAQAPPLPPPRVV